MKWGRSTASTSACFVEPTSLTTAPGRRSQSSRTAPGSASTDTDAIAMSASRRSATLATASSIAPQRRAVSSAAGLRFQPTTCAPRRRRAASPIEPPMSPTPSRATRIAPSRYAAAAVRRARTDAARSSSTATVVSQSMQASVIDCP